MLTEKESNYIRSNGKEINHFRAFRVTYLPMTESKPERCRIMDLRHKQTSIFSMSGLILDDAINHLESKKIICSGFSCDSHTGEYYIFTLDFETKLK